MEAITKSPELIFAHVEHMVDVRIYVLLSEKSRVKGQGSRPCKKH